MGKWIKRGAIALGVLLVLAAAGVATGLQLAERKMARKVTLDVQPVALAGRSRRRCSAASTCSPRAAAWTATAPTGAGRCSSTTERPAHQGAQHHHGAGGVVAATSRGLGAHHPPRRHTRPAGR
jgi:hypothetical protein